jgi:hypothetical protein
VSSVFEACGRRLAGMTGSSRPLADVISNTALRSKLHDMGLMPTHSGNV